MTTQLQGDYPRPFQQIFAAFCVLMAEIWFLLFFQKLASKSEKLLIMSNRCLSNGIQTNFDSNVAIRTFEFSSASKQPHQKTNFLKRFAFLCVLCIEACCHFAPPTALLPLLAKRGEGWGEGIQTKSKGNFCLIIIYDHKTKFRG
jgi:hypothetical protein